MLHDKGKITDMVAACLILYNMCVSDRVMDGKDFARYNPANKLGPVEASEVTQVLKELCLAEARSSIGLKVLINMWSL